MSERSLTLDAGSDSIFVAGGESVLADYDLSSGYLPIAISSDPDKEFAGWYNGEDLMSYQDLPNVEGNQTWEAKFIDIEPSSIHLNFSSGSTDGVNPVTLTNQPLTIGGVPVIVNTASNGFTIDGESFSDPTISTQAAEACNAPIGVVGAVEGYEVLGTFIGVDLLDADHTGQLDTGEFFVGLRTVSKEPYRFGEFSGGFYFTDGPHKSIELETLDKFPMVVSSNPRNMGVIGFASDGAVVTSPHDLSRGVTYTPVYGEVSLVDRFTMHYGVAWSAVLEDIEDLTGEFAGATFGDGLAGYDGIIGRSVMHRTAIAPNTMLPNIVGASGPNHTVTSATDLRVEDSTRMVWLTDTSEITDRYSHGYFYGTT